MGIKVAFYIDYFVSTSICKRLFNNVITQYNKHVYNWNISFYCLNFVVLLPYLNNEESEVKWQLPVQYRSFHEDVNPVTLEQSHLKPPGTLTHTPSQSTARPEEHSSISSRNKRFLKQLISTECDMFLMFVEHVLIITFVF